MPQCIEDEKYIGLFNISNVHLGRYLVHIFSILARKIPG
jgi:hypothetical protein